MGSLKNVLAFSEAKPPISALKVALIHVTIVSALGVCGVELCLLVWTHPNLCASFLASLG